MAKRLIVGISGASGAPLAVEMLKKLADIPDVEVHLIVTRGGEMTLKQEMGIGASELKKYASRLYKNKSIGERPASGSFRTMGMIVVPCSMKTAAGIVSGYSDNLLLRSADVCLKEKRKLVLVARESPLSTVHLRNLYKLSRMGVVIMPPMISYYRTGSSLEDITSHMAGRILDQFGLNDDDYEWEGMQ